MPDPTLTHAPDPRPADDPDATTATGGGPGSDTDGPPAPTGYDLLGPVGTGGMGTVHRARDRALGRDVAVKFLHPRYAPGSPTARRFTDEARITARLQHPGIPPVHELGTLADGRPFLVMKLIDGRTLDALLQGQGTAGDGRGRLVAAFEQVCQAVAYAHAQGIIHRDLKPANIMVGAFGEVQVMDWGLAKAVAGGRGAGDGGQKSGDTRPEARDDEAAGRDATLAGSLLGTPAYMPPEQARGEPADERADVFGLGAILCAILTGWPPFAGNAVAGTLARAAAGDTADARARLDACGAEPELVALCKRCLSADPGGRAADAGAVAAAVTALRADAERRARQAETDRATAEVKAAEERKRRRVWLGLGAAGLALVAVAGLAAWLVARQRAATAVVVEQERDRRQAAEREAERELEAALAEVQVLRDEGVKQSDDPHRWGLTLTAARAALKRADAARSRARGSATYLHDRYHAVRRALEEDERDRDLLAELDRIGEQNDIRYLIPLVLSTRAAKQYAAAFREHGLDLAGVSTERALAWLKGHRFRARLTAAVRSWRYALPGSDVRELFGPDETDPLVAAGGGLAAARPELDERLALLVDAATDDPFAREWWAAARRTDVVALKKLLARPELEEATSEALASFADGLIDLGSRRPQAEGPIGDVFRQLLEGAYRRFPGEYWVNFRLAQHLDNARRAPDQPGGRPHMVRHLSAAVAARPRSAAARVALAITLIAQDEHDTTAAPLLAGAADLDPKSAWPSLLLADIALRRGEYESAEEAVARAVRTDPDTGFFLANTLLFRASLSVTGRKAEPPDRAFLTRVLDRLVRENPAHPGGFDLRAGFRYQGNDYGGALADMRAGRARARPGYLRGANTLQGTRLEELEAWGKKLPAALRGDLKLNANELCDLAEYCAGFEQKFALAARFAGEARAALPGVSADLFKVPRFAGWAALAGSGVGRDAADLPPAERARLRGLALAWLREGQDQSRQPALFGAEAWRNPDLAPVRGEDRLGRLPASEQNEWRAFWAGLPNPLAPRPEPAPPPRERKR